MAYHSNAQGRLEMVGNTHSEGPGAVVGLAGFLGSTEETVIIIALEMKLPVGSDIHAQTDSSCQTGLETAVVIIDILIAPTCVGLGIVGSVDIAVAILRDPISTIATSHEVDADSLTADGEVGHQGELQILILVIGLVLVADTGIVDSQLSGIVLGHKLHTAADAEPFVELITHTSLDIETAGGMS